jgi:4-amino-4-deoxy-L-arabinose transferase-like glycosyltransferase
MSTVASNYRGEPAEVRGGNAGRRTMAFVARHGEAFLVCGLFVLAAAIRFPNLWLEPRILDEWREAHRGLQIAQGDLFPATNVSAYIGALWNYILAVPYLLLGDDFRVPRLVVMLLGALTVVPTYLLGREIGGRGAAVLGGALMVTSPVHILANSHVAWSHCSTPLFTTTACWLLVSAVHLRSARRLAVSGFVWGLAFQTHPTVLALLPGAALYLWLNGRQMLRPRPLAPAAGLFLLASLSVFAYMAYDPVGFFGSVQARQEQYTRRASSDFAVRIATNFGQLWLSVGRLPSGVVLQSNAWRDVLANPLVWGYGLALGGGAAVAARRREPIALCLLGSGALLLPLFQPGSFYPVPDGRFAMPLLPPLYASLACAFTQGSRPSRPWTRGAARALPAVGALLTVVPLTSLAAYYGRPPATGPRTRGCGTRCSKSSSARRAAVGSSSRMRPARSWATTTPASVSNSC